MTMTKKNNTDMEPHEVLAFQGYMAAMEMNEKHRERFLSEGNLSPLEKVVDDIGYSKFRFCQQVAFCRVFAPHVLPPEMLEDTDMEKDFIDGMAEALAEFAKQGGADE